MITQSRPSLAVFGGTFDPVHIGHCRLAIQVQQLGFEQVLMIPNRTPPHRPQPRASAAHRLAMLERATQQMTGVAVSDIELEYDAISYTAETVAQLRQLYPQHAITWVMGADAWADFLKWKNWQSIIEHANLLVINRPGTHLDDSEDPVLSKVLRADTSKSRLPSAAQLTTVLAGHVAYAQWPELDISASDLRQAISRGDNIDYLTPSSVLDYINQHALYR